MRLISPGSRSLRTSRLFIAAFAAALVSAAACGTTHGVAVISDDAGVASTDAGIPGTPGQVDAAPAPLCGPGTMQCGDRCVDVSLDPKNCGACGVACANGDVCSAGTCGTTCVGGSTRCGDRCVDTSSDRANCGGCTITGVNDAGAGDAGSAPGNDAGGAGSTVCAAGEVCSAGVCAVSCQANLVECGGTCVDPTTSRAFCGATAGCGGDAGSAGTACGNGQVCNAGVCETSCLASQVLCGGKCVDPNTDHAFCGAQGDCQAANAGTACTDGEVCKNGACQTTCLPSQVLCGGKCVDPQTDLGYCGAQGDCQAANAGTSCTGGQMCSGGACTASCGAGFTKCTPAGGGASYCANTTSDPSNCGGCESACPARASATATCAAGTCSFTCNANRADCNLQAGDGCEVDLETDKGNCGTCGNKCASGSCFAGSCTPKCADIMTSMNQWGHSAHGVSLTAFTGGTLEWIGAVDSEGGGFFCTDEANGITFGSNSAPLRAVVDPGNAGGEGATTQYQCCSAGAPRAVCNAPMADNSGQGGLNSGDALCKAMGFTSGVVVSESTSNGCPRPYSLNAGGTAWSSTWVGPGFGQQYRCTK